MFYCSVECQKAAWARPVAGHARTCAALGDLQKRAGAMTFGLDKMVCAECDFGPTTPDLLSVALHAGAAPAEWRASGTSSI